MSNTDNHLNNKLDDELTAQKNTKVDGEVERELDFEAIGKEVGTNVEAADSESKQVGDELTNSKKQKKIKLAKIYRRRFSKSGLNRKLLKKIYIPADKALVQRFVREGVDKKNRAYYFFDTEKITDRRVVKNLNRIAKEVKKQKGRINYVPLLAVLVAIVLLFGFTYLFRNFIARKIVVGASESAFGAKCDVAYIDFNLWNTRFQIKNYAVANKNSVMRNLFEIENIDIYFNLLELTRGKFVAENIAVEGITWNTERKTSGALPAKKPKPKTKSSNPIIRMVEDETEKIKQGISVSEGFSAVREKIDPRLIFEREKKALQSPAIKDKIVEFAPALVEKWETTANETYADISTFVEKAERLVKTDVANFQTVDEVADFILGIKEMIELSEKNIHTAEILAQEVKTDIAKISTLITEADSAVRRDMNRIVEIANTINDIRLDGGSKFVSSLVRIFYIKTLGVYYPKVMSAVEYIESMQRSPKQKPPTLKDKAFSLERLKGREILFSNHSMPSLVFKNIALSGHHPENKFKIGGSVQNVTNNADQLNLPITMNLNAEHGKLSEEINGLVDLRKKSEDFVGVNVSFKGLEIDLQSDIEGLPGLSGVFSTMAEVNVNKQKDVKIITDGVVNNAKMQSPDFEPAFISRIYNEVLARIHTVDLQTELNKVKSELPTLAIHTGVDNQIVESMQKQFMKELEKVKSEVIRIGKEYLAEIKKEYTAEYEVAEKVYDIAKLAVVDSKSAERLLQKKLKEAEKIAKKMATSKLEEAKNEAEKKAKETLNNALKGLFN